jgi:hypothetical protein
MALQLEFSCRTEQFGPWFGRSIFLFVLWSSTPKSAFSLIAIDRTEKDKMRCLVLKKRPIQTQGWRRTLLQSPKEVTTISCFVKVGIGKKQTRLLTRIVEWGGRRTASCFEGVSLMGTSGGFWRTTNSIPMRGPAALVTAGNFVLAVPTASS